MYDELITMRFFGIPRNPTPWVLVFVNSEHIDSKRAMQQYRYLAKKMEGKVRFGWVIRNEEELLAESFGAKELPATFFIKDGVAYHYRDFTYADKLYAYITEKGYYKSTTNFYQPARFFLPQLYLYAYVHKFFRLVYRRYIE